MILVVLGTWEKQFTRPLLEIERAVEAGLITGKIIVQSGRTEFSSQYMEVTPFFDKKDLEKLYDQADLIICQAGVGSIMMGLERNKKVTAIARLKKYDEHIDDHQIEILDVFSKNKYIMAWDEGRSLRDVLAEMAGFTPVPYPFGNHGIEDAIIDYIESGMKNKNQKLQ